MKNRNISAQINVEFSEPETMTNIQSGEEIKTLFGKIRKYFSSMKKVAFSGSYNDLTDTPNYAGSSSAGGAATSAAKLAAARTIDGVDFDGSANITHLGTCSTAAATAAKVVTCSGFKLSKGARITVIFTNTNTASNVTLNVNNTGAKAVRYGNDTSMTQNLMKLVQNSPIDFVYDGSIWKCTLSQSYVTQNSTTSNSDLRLLLSNTATDGLNRATSNKSSKFTANPSTGILKAPTFSGALSGNAASAAKLASARKINGVAFDGTKDITIPCSLPAGGLLASGNGNASTGYTAAISELSNRNSLLAEITVKDSSNNRFYVSLTIPAAYIVSGETFIVSRVVTNGTKSYNQTFYVTATGNNINIQQKVPQTTVVSEAKIYGLS